MKFLINDTTIWEETDEVKIHVPDNPKGFFFMYVVYRLIEKKKAGYKTVESKAIYFDEMPVYIRALAEIMVKAQAVLSMWGKEYMRKEFEKRNIKQVEE